MTKLLKVTMSDGHTGFINAGLVTAIQPVVVDGTKITLVWFAGCDQQQVEVKESPSALASMIEEHLREAAPVKAFSA